MKILKKMCTSVLALVVLLAFTASNPAKAEDIVPRAMLHVNVKKTTSDGYITTTARFTIYDVTMNVTGIQGIWDYESQSNKVIHSSIVYEPLKITPDGKGVYTYVSYKLKSNYKEVSQKLTFYPFFK